MAAHVDCGCDNNYIWVKKKLQSDDKMSLLATYPRWAKMNIVLEELLCVYLCVMEVKWCDEIIFPTVRSRVALWVSWQYY